MVQMNLWTDFENNQPTSLAPVRNGRVRRLTEQSVLSSLRHWLLDEYVSTYCRSLAASRIFRRCYWVDGLGLEGKAQTLPAVQALAQQLRQQERPIALYGMFLEAESRKPRKGSIPQSNGSSPTQTSRVAKPTPALTIPKEGGVLRASWLEASPALFTEMDQSPAVFLLNPFRQTLFPYESLLPLYQRAVPTELLFLLSHRQLETHLSSALRSPVHGSLLTALLRSDRWKTLSKVEDILPESVDGLIELFIASMQRHFLLPVQRIALPVQVRPAVVEIIPYTLLFATRRQDSLLAMNDASCLYRRRVYEQSHRGVLSEEWFQQQQQTRFVEGIEQIRQRILQKGRAQRVRRWPELRQQVLLTAFGQFTTHDYDTMIRELLAAHEVRCEWKRKSVEENESVIPGNEDTLLWR